MLKYKKKEHKLKAVTRSFLGFADNASNILHIKSSQDYKGALELIENLFDEAEDTIDEPLNNLIEMIAHSIQKYESSLEEVVNFENKANNIKQEVSVLRVLMEQHNLTTSGFNSKIV